MRKSLLSLTLSPRGRKGIILLIAVLFSISSVIAAETKTAIIKGTVICNACPCDNILDFNADVRAGDTVFAAITSLDGTRLFSTGPLFTIR